MSVHFEVTDPRGRTVVCTDDVWRWHICGGHFEMEGSEAQVKAAIRKPQHGIIYRDVDNESRDVYYFRPAGKRYYIKVIVEFDSVNRGSVITAFRTSAAKSGERIIWPG